jgi:hypothetical protein
MLAFSKPMRYPKNWIQKYLVDTEQDEMADMELVDAIKTPLITFWYEQVQEEPPYKQVELTSNDVKILQLLPTSISFNISF